MENSQLVLRHVDKARARASCPICGRNMLKRTLQRHLRAMHSLVVGQLAAVLRCNACGEIFGRKDNLNRHILTQHDRKDDQIECLTCGASVRERSLGEHYSCQKCLSAQRFNRMELCMNIVKNWQGNACSLNNLGRFAPESVLNPFMVACVLCTRFPYYLDLSAGSREFRPIEYLQLRGLALRTVSRRLDDQYMRESGCLEGAINFLLGCDLDSNVSSESRTLWALYCFLESLHSTGFNIRMEKSNDACVNAAYQGMLVHCRTFEALRARFQLLGCKLALKTRPEIDVPIVFALPFDIQLFRGTDSGDGHQRAVSTYPLY